MSSRYNHKIVEKKWKDTWSTNKVIQTKNNYDKGVYNGDIGYVKKIDLIDKLLWVDFDNKLVKISSSSGSNS